MSRLLDRLSTAFALAGGAVLCALVLLATGSIVGRALFGTPLLGDFELMQLGIALAIALALPYCQWHGGHIVVDFFTLCASPRTRGGLDTAGAWLAGAIHLLLAWRVAVAVADLRASGETTMLLGLPLWLAYLALVPGLLLAAANAVFAAVQRKAPA